ncbi:hypothetical protein ACHAXA_011646 [Cyclostephanos tholiformis]|uniref:Uncharacterized protein n=1 Tax=Cyclostephanos tholiformis TaxID=382380 RepID=A0ABD3SES1_9STRA
MASQFVGGVTQQGAASPERPAAPPTSTTSHASQFASMEHLKEVGQDYDPESTAEQQQDTAAIHPTTESSHPITIDMGDMTNWANTALDHSPPTASLTDEPTSPLSMFMPTISPVRVMNSAEAFREHHGEDAFVDETEVLGVDDSMTRGINGVPPHMTESYATASYVANVEDGPYASFPTDDVPILGSSPSTNADADESEPSGTVCPGDVRTCPDGSFVSREVDNECNFAPCLDRADPNAGHFYPVWESSGIVVCVDGASPPSWASGNYLKQTKSGCCEAYSMLRVNECLLG